MSHVQRSRIGIILTAAVALAPACSAPAPADNAAAVVQDVVQSLEDAANARDWEVFFANFSEDADLVVFESPRAVGRSAARVLMEAGWSGVPDDVTADLTVASVRFLTPDVILADIDAEFNGSRPSTDRATAVLTNRAGSWLITAFRIMQPAGVLPSSDGPPDAVTADPAHYSVELENSLIRVLRVTYPPGSRSTMHSHPAYCAVLLSPGTFEFTMPDGGTTGGTRSASGDVSCVDAEVHDPTNVGGEPVSLVLVELKGRETFAP